MKKGFREGLAKTGTGLRSLFEKLPFHKLKSRSGLRWVGLILLVIVLFMLVLAFLWGRAPAAFDPQRAALARAGNVETNLVTGYITTATLITLADTLLHKRGGYLTNDVTPPSIFMDDMPNWEYGLLVQIRDLADTLRNDMSRSRSQSLENPDLAEASPLFNFDNNSWIFPSTESQYRKAIAASKRYLANLAQQNQADAQFYARADNLRVWLSRVELRLGGLSQRLSACVGEVRSNTDLAGETGARQSTEAAQLIVTKTPWLEIDDVFFEARGYAWGLLHTMKAIRVDFEAVLEKKNATALVDQIIRELEGTQKAIWSPMILNGSGFGLWANHSLVMASYISRANAAIIDLRDVLSQG